MAEAAAPTHWVHDLDPFAIQFSGDWGIRWYGLAYLAGIWLGWYLAKRWARKGRLPISEVQVDDLAVYIGLCMVLGGRLGYMLLYYGQGGELGTPWAFLTQPWTFFYFMEGGMASHGGIVGFFVAIGLFCRKYKVKFWVIADVVAAVCPIGIFFGRLANFNNGELWGRPGQVPWAVHFPDSVERLTQDQLQHIEALRPSFPQALQDVAAYKIPSMLTPDMALYDPIIRIVTEARHPSQLYAAFLEGLMILMIALPIHVRHQRPGLTSGVVLSVYAIGRIIGEFWREPDRGAGLFLNDLFSKGQIFSVPFLIFGIYLITKAYRQGPQTDSYLPPIPVPESKDSKAAKT